MRKLEESRKYEVLMPDGTWEPAHWEQIDMGDVVRQTPNSHMVDMFFDGKPFKVAEQPNLMVDKIEDTQTREEPAKEDAAQHGVDDSGC